MREIKFRGYDKEYEKMTYFDDEDYLFQFWQVLRQEIEYNFDYDREDVKYDDVTDKIEIMQYTGLHDKNGKEIYEGDIVKVNDEIIAKVIWEEGYLGYFLYANEENGIETFENGEQPLYDYFGYIEVIGNIYDNLELLEEGEK